MAERTLLIYESDSKHAKALKKAFEQFDFTVYVAKSEDEVQAHLGSGVVSLFIIRAENPNLGGFLLCKKVREISEYRHVPILLLSSEATEQTFEKHRSLDFAADYYMKLPADTDSILAAAHALFPFIDAEEGAEAAPAATAPAAAPVTEDRSAELRGEIERLQTENERLAGEIGSLKEELAAKAEEVREAGKKGKIAEEYAAEMDKAAEQMRALQETIKKLEVELAQERENAQRALEERTVVSKTVEDLKAQLKEESERSLKGASEQVEELKKKLDEARDELEDLRIVNKEMKEKVKMAEKDTERMKAEHEEFLAKKEGLEKRIADAEARAVQQIEEMKAAFEKKEADAREEAARLAEEMRSGYEAKIKPLEDEVKIKSEKIELLQAEKEALEIDAATAKYKAEQQEKQIAETQTKLEAAEKELAELRETVLQFSQISDERDAVQKERDDLAAKLAEREKTCVELEGRVAGAMAEISDLQNRTEAIAAEKVTLEKRVAELELVAKKLEKLEKAIAEKEKENAHLNEQIQSLLARIEAARKALEG